MLFQLILLYRHFCLDVLLASVFCFFSIFRPHKPLKMHHRSMKNLFKAQSTNWTFLNQSFGGFWEDFGSQVGSKLDQESMESCPKNQSIFYHLFDLILIDFRKILRFNLAPRGPAQFFQESFLEGLGVSWRQDSFQTPQECLKDKFWINFHRFYNFFDRF